MLHTFPVWNLFLCVFSMFSFLHRAANVGRKVFSAKWKILRGAPVIDKEGPGNAPRLKHETKDLSLRSILTCLPAGTAP